MGVTPNEMIDMVYCFSSLMVILPFFAVFTTFIALSITLIPNLDISAEEMVISLGFDFDVFCFIL